MSRLWHACTHTTFAPTVAHGGTKTNVIPDRVDLEVDIRTLPGQTGTEATAMLRDALGDLADAVEIESNDDPSTSSPVDTPLWDSLARVTRRPVRGVGAGAVADGGWHRQPVLPARRRGRVRVRPLLDSGSPYEDYATMFHGNDERVDQESLALSTQLWEAVARDLVG